MHGGGDGKGACEIGPQHPHQFHALERRGEQRGVHCVGECGQILRWLHTVGDNQAGQLGRLDVFECAQSCRRFQSAEVGEFSAPHHLYPVGVDEIQVADQAFAGIAYMFVVEFAGAAFAAGDPVKTQFFAVVL